MSRGQGRVDLLRRGLQIELSFCENMQRQGKEPSEEQMGSYLQGLQSKVGSAAGPPPSGDAIKEGFLEKMQSGIGFPGAVPSLGDLLGWMKGIVKEYIEMENEVKQQQIGNVTPTPEELSSLELACNRLWLLDTQRLEANKDYKLNLQKGKKSYQSGDFATQPLFEWVDESALEKDTYKAFIALLDNYEVYTGASERVDAEEVRETHAFLNACLETGPIRYAMEYLIAKGVVKDEQDFKCEMWTLWFKFYCREVRNDSSGFEHVFVGEIRDDKVLGMHNWIQIYHEEKKGILDYKGYIKPRRRGTNSLMCDLSEEQLLTIQFEWNGKLKSVGSSFIGTSPEFELALYTICFLCGDEDNELQIGPYAVCVKCHRIARDKIGTSYPESAPLNQTEAATRIQTRERTRSAQRSYYSRS